MTSDGVEEEELLRPGAAAKLLGIKTRTLANWSDAGIVSPIVTVGGHRRYREVDIEKLRAADDTTASSTGPTPPKTARSVPRRNAGSFARRGRPLTQAEVQLLVAAETARGWAELAAGYQADGSSIRQIAAATGTLPATVAARIARLKRRS